MSSYGAVDWALYLVIQADGVLHEPAVRAVSDLQMSIKKHQNGVPGTIHVVVDLLGKESATRYVFNTDGEYSAEQTAYGLDPVGYSKEGAACAFTRDARQTMLIFSGHGSGVITPRWDESKQKWLAEPDEGESPYTQYYRAQDKLFYEKVHQALEVKSLFLRKDGTVLFSQPQLNDLLCYVSNDLLQGRKIDIVGFDSCHMAMLEIAYDLRLHARYLIASQECEQKEGWDYAMLGRLLMSSPPLTSSVRRTQCEGECIERLAYHLDRELVKDSFDFLEKASIQNAYRVSLLVSGAGSECDRQATNFHETESAGGHQTPFPPERCTASAGQLELLKLSQEISDAREIARSIVYSYETAQRKKDKTLYSLSALDLQYVDDVASALDRFIEALNQVPEEDAQELMIALIKARHNNQRFTAMTSYADLITFCDALLDELSLLFETPQITQVKDAVLDLLFTTNKFIIASCAGSSCSKARGCSIYFPVAHCDSSYHNPFEQEHSWREFIHRFIGN